jgi:hypothetical protein
MEASDIDQNALKMAAVALKAAIADFDPGESKEAKTVLSFVDQQQLMDDAIRGLIDEPLERVPNAERALDGALQGYPQLEKAFYAFTAQLQGIKYVSRVNETVRNMAAMRQTQ